MPSNSTSSSYQSLARIICRVGKYVRYFRLGLLALTITFLAVLNQATAYNTTKIDKTDDGFVLIVTGNGFKGHEWILHKAIQYVKQNGTIAPLYSIDRYLNWLHQGIRYADHNYPTCEWKSSAPLTGASTFALSPFLFGAPIPLPMELQQALSCDTIHHHAETKSIETYGITTAHPGGFAAPEYAQSLYEQAVKFWPGGRAPSLSELEYRDAGYITTRFDTTSLLNTYLGGLPFCEAYIADASQTPERFVPGDCPKWPKWAALDEEWTQAREDVETAFKYLGWAIHLVEDLTVPQHAFNEASPSHTDYENAVDEWIRKGEFDHLPVLQNETYQTSLINGSDQIPFSAQLAVNWTIEDYAEEAVHVARKTYEVAKTDLSSNSKYIAERGLDAAIKLVAGMLEKFFTEVSLTPDVYEDNDNYTQAQVLSTGRHTGLTLDSARDEDWYKIVVNEDFSNLVIDAYYDKRWGNLSYELTSMDNGFTPRYPDETESGRRISVSVRHAGVYYLNVKRPLNSAAIPYDLHVIVETGALPADDFEDNDNPQSARKFFTGCDHQLNIDRAGDDDYYFLNVDNHNRLDVTVTYDPDQGEIDLSLDGVQASPDNSSSGGHKSLTISKNGSGTPELVRVSGSRTSYAMCMNIETCVVDRTRDCRAECVDDAMARAWTGDGICDNGAYGMNLLCSKFNFDGDDCAPGKSCGGAGQVNDCVGNCVDQATAMAWIGDGFCDDGKWGMDLRCAAFSHDGNDCSSAARGDDGDTCAAATQVESESIEAAIETPGDVDWFEIAGSGSSAYLIIEITGSTDVDAALYSACGESPIDVGSNSGGSNKFSAYLQVSDDYSYFVRVKHAQAQAGGDYTLKVKRIPLL